jgi:hypothetical protein
MAKSITQALLANEVANLLHFQSKGLIEPVQDKPKVSKVSKNVKVNVVKTKPETKAKTKPAKADKEIVIPAKADKKHTDADLSKYAKKSQDFADIMARPYGKEGHTFGEAIEHSASVYTGMLRAKRQQLEKLKVIGEVLHELRSLIGTSDKLFGQAVKSTALKNMSRQDRSDAMWLAENWINIQSKTKELDVSSCSASYLRQLLRKTEKQSATTQESTKGTDAVATEQVTEPVITEGKSDTKATPTEGSSTVEPSTLKLAEDSAEGIASAVIGLAKAKNISLAEIATLLLASAE